MSQPAERALPNPSTCSVPVCDREIHSRGLCHTHYCHLLRTGEMPTHKIIGRWKGDAIGWGAAHKRAKKVLPESCAHADGTCKGRLDVALRRDAPPEVLLSRENGHLYSPRPEHYIRLCHSHHVRYDADELKTHCKHGHEFTPENTRKRRSGRGRRCIACERLRYNEKDSGVGQPAERALASVNADLPVRRSGVTGESALIPPLSPVDTSFYASATKAELLAEADRLAAKLDLRGLVA